MNRLVSNSASNNSIINDTPSTTSSGSNDTNRSNKLIYVNSKNSDENSLKIITNLTLSTTNIQEEEADTNETNPKVDNMLANNDDSEYSSSVSSMTKEPDLVNSETTSNETLSITNSASTSNSNSNLENLDAPNNLNASFLTHEDILLYVEQILGDLVDRVVEKSLQDTNFIDDRFRLFEKLFIDLQLKLDDLRAFYIELNDFYELVQTFEKFFSKCFLGEKRAADQVEDDEENLSMTVNNVLQYFDFLNDPENDCDATVDGSDKKFSSSNQSSTETTGLNLSFSHSFIDNRASFKHLFDFDQLLIVHFSSCIKLLNVSAIFCRSGLCLSSYAHSWKSRIKWVSSYEY